MASDSRGRVVRGTELSRVPVRRATKLPRLELEDAPSVTVAAIVTFKPS